MLEAWRLRRSFFGDMRDQNLEIQNLDFQDDQILKRELGQTLTHALNLDKESRTGSETNGS